MFTKYLLDEKENPFRLTQEVPSVYFAQGIISGKVANVNCNRLQNVGEQICKFSKNLRFVSKF